jgi:AraC-like DNA-binding protein
MASFSASFIHSIIYFASRELKGFASFAEIPQIDLDSLRGSPERFDVDCYEQVIQTALNTSADPSFGLHLGEYLNLASAGLVGQIAQSAPDVRTALQAICDFAALGCESLPIKVLEENGRAGLELRPDPLWEERYPASVRHTADFYLVFGIRDLAYLTLEKHGPTQIDLKYRQDQSHEEWKRIAGCSISYQQDAYRIWIPAELMDQPVHSADHQLYLSLCEFAQQRVADHKILSFSSKVRDHLLQLWSGGPPEMNQVAANLNISSRSLQRRLAEEGLSYRQMVEECRQEMATSLLSKRRFQLAEIADILGYSESSTFSRSFKKWHGRSPSQWLKFQ